MRISGEASIKAPLDRVWWALNDPAVLVRTIPGCRVLEETGPDAYRMTVTAGTAVIRGTYSGTVRISEQVEPTALVLRVSGAGAPGTVSADVRVRLTAVGKRSTAVRYDAQATATGVRGAVRQHIAARAARRSANDFLRNVEDVLTGRGAPTHALTSGVEPMVLRESRAVVKPASPALPAARPVPVGRAAPAIDSFTGGATVGAAGALLGVLVGWLIGRRR